MGAFRRTERGSAARPSREQREAREALERHWAVAALPAPERAAALVAADRAWEGMDAVGAPSGRRLSTSERELVERAADAWERAALDRIGTVLGERPSDASAARTELAVAAQLTFRLRRVLPLPGEERAAHHLALRLAAMAVVADDAAAFAHWRAQAGARLPLDTPPALAWEATMRRAVARALLDLLAPPAGLAAADVVDECFEVLGELRELRAVRESEYLLALPTAEADLGRTQLIALYTLANVAATLVVHARRGPFAETPARIAADLGALRSLAAGTLDRLIPWLQVAAEQVAARQGAQIPLPGLLA